MTGLVSMIVVSWGNPESVFPPLIGHWSVGGWHGCRAACSCTGRSLRRLQFTANSRSDGAFTMWWALLTRLFTWQRLALASGPTLISALVFAIALLGAPWFIMQPALGLGFFAARTPHPSLTRIINISGHATFGVGLYFGAIAISFL